MAQRLWLAVRGELTFDRSFGALPAAPLNDRDAALLLPALRMQEKIVASLTAAA